MAKARETTKEVNALELLKSGVEKFNAYRKENPEWDPELCDENLSDADLREVNLSGAHLVQADLCRADLRGANLFRASMSGTDLIGADLRGANLCGVELCYANLHEANLCGVDLKEVNLEGAILHRTDLDKVVNFIHSNIVGANFSHAKNLTETQKNLVVATLLDTMK